MEEADHQQTSEESDQSFPVGQLVFAKVKGFPAWPAKVKAVRVSDREMVASTLSYSLAHNRRAL